MDRVWVGHCFKNLDPDEVGQDAGPQGVAFPDSVLGSLGLARLGDVTEMVQTFTWPMPHIFLSHRGSCCDVCQRVFCLCSPLGVL